MATFRKHEHLKSTRIISKLIEQGHSFSVPPLKLIWLSTSLTSKSPAQVAFSVPKKNFPRAVDRNKIKRKMRECYREHKNKLYDFLNDSGVRLSAHAEVKQYALMVVFTGKEEVPFRELMMKFTLTLQRLEKEIK